MAFSQLTPLFLDLNMPAILDLLFLIYKRPATATQPIIATVAARTGFYYLCRFAPQARARGP